MPVLEGPLGSTQSQVAVGNLRSGCVQTAGAHPVSLCVVIK